MSTISKNGYFRPFFWFRPIFGLLKGQKFCAKAKTNIWLEADFFKDFYKHCFIAIHLIERLL